MTVQKKPKSFKNWHLQRQSQYTTLPHLKQKQIPGILGLAARKPAIQGGAGAPDFATLQTGETSNKKRLPDFHCFFRGGTPALTPWPPPDNFLLFCIFFGGGGAPRKGGGYEGARARGSWPPVQESRKGAARMFNKHPLNPFQNRAAPPKPRKTEQNR